MSSLGHHIKQRTTARERRLQSFQSNPGYVLRVDDGNKSKVVVLVMLGDGGPEAMVFGGHDQ